MGMHASAPLAPTADSFAVLTVPERLIVWGMRAWVACIKSGQCPETCLREAYGRFGVLAAASSLDALMQVIRQATTRIIDVRCVNCPHLSPDEARLLQAFAALQQREPTTAWMALGSWLPPQTASFALGPADGLARLFAAAGWVLPQRAWDLDTLQHEQEAPGEAQGYPAGRPCTLH